MLCSDVEILYGGSIVFDYEVVSAIKHDAFLGLGSVFLILTLMFVLSGFSLWLTFAGFYAILTCFVPAYFVYRAIIGKWCVTRGQGVDSGNGRHSKNLGYIEI